MDTDKDHLWKIKYLMCIKQNRHCTQAYGDIQEKCITLCCLIVHLTRRSFTVSEKLPMIDYCTHPLLQFSQNTCKFDWQEEKIVSQF